MIYIYNTELSSRGVGQELGVGLGPGGGVRVSRIMNVGVVKSVGVVFLRGGGV